MLHSRRVAPAVVFVAAAVFALGACAPTSAGPSPASSSPAPLTDEEAFAAAEETYRAYVDALNEVDLSDPTTFEPVFDLTTGELQDETRKTLSQMSADGWSVSGVSIVSAVAGADRTAQIVRLDICLDVSEVLVRSASGEPVTSVDRAAIQTLEATVRLDDRQGPLVAAVGARSGDTQC